MNQPYQQVVLCAAIVAATEKGTGIVALPPIPSVAPGAKWFAYSLCVGVAFLAGWSL